MVGNGMKLNSLMFWVETTPPSAPVKPTQASSEPTRSGRLPTGNSVEKVAAVMVLLKVR